MRAKAVLGLTVVLLCTPTMAQKEKPFPKILAQAQYAFVETFYGSVESTVLDSRVTRDDRQAVAYLEKAIKTWGNYQLTAKPGEAEVIFVVRPGRLATTNSQIRLGRAGGAGQSKHGTTEGADAGGEVGPPRDLLAVYVQDSNGRRGDPLWQEALDHGLDPPEIPLFKKFKNQVEAAKK